jgi:hypothetical protein
VRGLVAVVNALVHEAIAPRAEVGRGFMMHKGELSC